jgi:preprotein translocase subunit SecG
MRASHFPDIRISMSFFIFLTVVQALVAAALVGVILMQRSEGGGLGTGGSPSGLMSARGAADFLTRSTAVLATLFVVLSIILAAMAVKTTTGRKIDTSLDRSAPAAPQPVPADALAPAANRGQTSPQPAQAPSPASNDPLTGAARK